MPSSRKLISSTTLASSSSTVVFSSIPQTYGDLCLTYSARQSASGTVQDIYFILNSDTTNNNRVYLRGGGGALSANRASSIAGLYGGYVNGDTTSANSFASGELYIPKYYSTNALQASMITGQQEQATDSYAFLIAAQYTGGSAVSSITITGGSDFLAGCSFYLYGLEKS